MLSPLLQGGAACDLRLASSLCGACYQACPVMIPLQDLLLALRRDAAPKASRPGALVWGLWSRAWSRPWVYRVTHPPGGLGARLVPSRLVPRWGAGPRRARPRRGREGLMERAAFLARLREQLRSAAPAAPRRAHSSRTRGGPRPPSGARSTDLAAAFTEEAEALGVQVRRVRPGGVPGFLTEVVAAHGVHRAVVSRDPEIGRGRRRTCRASGVAVAAWDGPAAAAGADLGVTGAAFGIAATGSLVVAADRAGGRSVSLLPPVHAALAPRSVAAGHPGRSVAGHGPAFPDGLASQVVVITGPSRTGDIELVLVRGVHGPGHVWVGLLEEA